MNFFSSVSRAARIGLGCAGLGLVGLPAFTTPAFAASPAPTYRTILAALQGGKPVKVLTNLARCTEAGTDKAGPPIETGLRIDDFMAIPGKGIAFSDVHQTLDASGKPVTEYIRYNLAPTDQLTLAVTRETATGAVDMPTLVCPVPSGATFVW